MELFFHSRRERTPRGRRVEATARSGLLVEGDPDGHVWIEEVDEEIDLDITIEDGRDPAPPPRPPRPLPPGRGRGPLQRRLRARVRPGHHHQDGREVGVRPRGRQLLPGAGGQARARRPRRRPLPRRRASTSARSSPPGRARSSSTCCPGRGSRDDARGDGTRRACRYATTSRGGRFLAGVAAGGGG